MRDAGRQAFVSHMSQAFSNVERWLPAGGGTFLLRQESSQKAFPRGEGGFKIANTLAILKTDEGCRAASFCVAYVAGILQC